MIGYASIAEQDSLVFGLFFRQKYEIWYLFEYLLLVLARQSRHLLFSSWQALEGVEEAKEAEVWSHPHLQNLPSLLMVGCIFLGTKSLKTRLTNLGSLFELVFQPRIYPSISVLPHSLLPS